MTSQETFWGWLPHLLNRSCFGFWDEIICFSSIVFTHFFFLMSHSSFYPASWSSCDQMSQARCLKQQPVTVQDQGIGRCGFFWALCSVADHVTHHLVTQPFLCTCSWCPSIQWDYIWAFPKPRGIQTQEESKTTNRYDQIRTSLWRVPVNMKKLTK